MNPTTPNPTSNTNQSHRFTWWKAARRLGVVLGFLLLVAAIILAWQQRHVVTQAMQSIQSMPTPVLIGWIALLLATVFANVILTGLLFFTLAKRYAPAATIGAVEMQAVMASATLLNFVPMRPGLFGRVAYHRVYNNIPVAASAKIIVESAALSAFSAIVALIICFIAHHISGSFWFLVFFPVVVAAAISAFDRDWSLLMLAAGLRYVDLLMMAVRYWIAFALIGSPLESSDAMTLACVGMIAMMAPFLSNGLGLREWAISLITPMLTTYQMTLGITADLINRAAEIAITVSTGLIGLGILAHHRAGRSRNKPG